MCGDDNNHIIIRYKSINFAKKKPKLFLEHIVNFFKVNSSSLLIISAYIYYKYGRNRKNFSNSANVYDF